MKTRSFPISKCINLTKSWNTSDKNQQGYLKISPNHQAICWPKVVESAFAGSHSGFISNLRWTFHVAWGQLSLDMLWIWRNLNPVDPENFKVLLKYMCCVKHSLMVSQELLYSTHIKRRYWFCGIGSEELFLKWLVSARNYTWHFC